ncbi:MAG TPA: biopolymer transporter ExbD [Steroidobacteraceae bacterium]|nr:biopolymer transporter ExbD [Steroidobacteraceae bacterium]
MNLRPRRSGDDPEINLISLIDVLMVLLVFFMLCSTFDQQGRMNIRLPTANGEARSPGGAEPIVVTVTEQGGYRVNEHELVNSGRDTLRRAVQQVAGTVRDGHVVLRADARATHQAVVTAMDVLGRMGFTQLDIATIPPPEGQ